MRHAIERRGVAVVVVPGEIFAHEAPARRPGPAVRAGRVGHPSRPTTSWPRRPTLLNRAERVTILAGAGCEGAHDELVAIAERLKAPVVHALRGKEFVEYDNPYDVGHDRPARLRLRLPRDGALRRPADARHRLPVPARSTPSGARVVQVDVRGEHIGRRVPVDVPLVGDGQGHGRRAAPGCPDEPRRRRTWSG